MLKNSKIHNHYRTHKYRVFK